MQSKIFIAIFLVLLTAFGGMSGCAPHTPSLQKSSHTPLPYSAFTQKNWENEVKKFHGSSRKITGFSAFVYSGRGYVTYEDAGNMILNGIWLDGPAFHDFKNNKPNQITVAVPGLVNRRFTEIEIYGDPDLDKVFLDACLKWIPHDKTQEFDVWEAKDHNDISKSVKVMRGLETAIQKHCDNRYILSETASEKALAKSPFKVSVDSSGTGPFKQKKN